MPGAVEEIVSEEGADVGKNFRRAGRVETVAAEVRAKARAIEAPGVATDRGSAVGEGDLEASPGQSPSRPQTSGASAQDEYERA